MFLVDINGWSDPSVESLEKLIMCRLYLMSLLEG